MSHIVKIESEIRDLTSLIAACRRLAIAEPRRETARLYSGEATGYCVHLPHWRYPVVCDLENGRVTFDNFRGSWGEQVELDRLMQAYAVERTRLEAQRKGHCLSESKMASGAIKLTIHVGGAA